MSDLKRWSFLHRIALGNELSVSPVCLGFVRDRAVVEAAFREGINFFFCTADMHWPVYTELRRGLEYLLIDRGVPRGEIVVAAVSYVTHPEFSIAPFVELVRSVRGLDYLDLTIVGGAYGSDLLPRRVQYERHRREVGPLKGVQCIGATFHDRAAAAWAMRHQLVDIAYARYSPDHPGAEDDLFPQVQRDVHVPLYNFNSMQGVVTEERLKRLSLPAGSWRPRPVDHYRYAIRRSEVSGLLVSLDSIDHLTKLRNALREGPLTDEEAHYLRAIVDLAAGRSELY